MSSSEFEPQTNQRKRPRPVLLVMSLVAVIAVAIAAGFLVTNRSEPAEDSLPTFPPTPAPEWEEVLKSASESVSSEAAQEVLMDGRITEEEVRSVRETFKSCVESTVGISDISIQADGRVQFDTPDNFDESSSQQIDSCGNTSGFDETTAWLNTVLANPEHLDYNTIMADCLVRMGVVSVDYSGEMFLSDNKDFSFPFTVPEDEGREAVMACQSDPMGNG